jgi:hypothetical protein
VSTRMSTKDETENHVPSESTNTAVSHAWKFEENRWI